MKTLVLSALLLGMSSVTYAQMGGLGVSPLGATPDDSITIYVRPGQVCATGQNIPLDPNPTSVRMHSGVNGYMNVVSASPLNAGGAPYSVVGFVNMGNGTWKKTIKPSAYYGVAGNTINGMNVVLNGGPDSANRWATEGKYYNVRTNVCNDFYIPFPITDTAFGITATKPDISSNVQLHSAYPNPTGTETTIRMLLKKPGQVNVYIRNILGETVATLASGYMAQGEKSYSWNVAHVPAGIYFYTVETAGVRGSSKIQVIR